MYMYVYVCVYGVCVYVGRGYGGISGGWLNQSCGFTNNFWLTNYNNFLKFFLLFYLYPIQIF